MPGTDRFFRIRSSALFAACLAGMLVSQPAFAADSPGGDAISIIHGLENGLFRLLQVFLGIGCLGSVVMATVNVLEGRPEAAKRFFYSVVAFALGETLLSVFGTVSSNSAGSATLLALTMSVLQSALSMVAMITVIGVVVKVMSADEQAVRRFFVWLIASVTGIILLNVFYKVAVDAGASI